MSHKLSHHKLRIVVHVDVDPGNIGVDVGGCLTQSNFPALLHLLLRAQRLASAPEIAVDLRRAIHLDAGVLAHLRHIASPGSHRAGQHAAIHHEMGLAAAAALEEADDFRLTLLEPVYLPVCPIHSAADGAAARRDAAKAALVEHPNQPTDPAHPAHADHPAHPAHADHPAHPAHPAHADHPVRPSRAASVRRSTRERTVKALHVHF